MPLFDDVDTCASARDLAIELARIEYLLEQEQSPQRVALICRAGKLARLLDARRGRVGRRAA